jgi:hypothetical protein
MKNRKVIEMDLRVTKEVKAKNLLSKRANAMIDGYIMALEWVLEQQPKKEVV